MVGLKMYFFNNSQVHQVRLMSLTHLKLIGSP
nr:MAG TPA: hypothetical protein [Caudoviricetes sp.]